MAPTSPSPEHSGTAPTPSEAWQEQDDFVNEALEESFPASDPMAPGHVPSTPTPGQ